MIDLEPRLSLPKLLVIAVFAVPIGAMEFGEWLHWRAAQQLPLEPGTVVRREEFRRWGGIPAGQQHIQIAKDKAMVRAEARGNSFKFPAQVQVHYAGNANDEVVLADEANPGWLAALSWGPTVALWILYFAFRNRPGARGMFG